MAFYNSLYLKFYEHILFCMWLFQYFFISAILFLFFQKCIQCILCKFQSIITTWQFPKLINLQTFSPRAFIAFSGDLNYIIRVIFIFSFFSCVTFLFLFILVFLSSFFCPGPCALCFNLPLQSPLSFSQYFIAKLCLYMYYYCLKTNSYSVIDCTS